MNDEHIDKAYRNLACAIVKRAVDDYRNAILYNDDRMMTRCEHFFESNYCEFLSGVSGKNLPDKLRSETLDFKEKAIKFFDVKEHDNDKKPTEEAFKCPTCKAWVDVIYLCISRRYKTYGYDAKCRSCGLEYKRKLNGEPIISKD